MTIVIDEFSRMGPIGDEVIQSFAPLAPEGAIELWRTYGAGMFRDGFMRIVDPARAAAMLRGVIDLPDGSVTMFSGPGRAGIPLGTHRGGPRRHQPRATRRMARRPGAV